MSTEPLASRMRPKNIDEIISQQHLVGPKGIIRRMVDTKRLSSMIFYGPPGIGKTSIAKAISGSTQFKFRQLNAVTNTKKDMQLVVEEAKMSGQVILLLDEIHRLDKAKEAAEKFKDSDNEQVNKVKDKINEYTGGEDNKDKKDKKDK